ncbi:MAG: hypothetical protein ACIPMY_04990 [Rickettsia endosymbiont of Pentastiridius leporinus]
MKRIITSYNLDFTKKEIISRLRDGSSIPNIVNQLSNTIAKYNLIMENVLIDLLNNIIAQIDNTIKLEGTDYKLPFVNSGSISDLIKISSETHKYFDQTLPHEGSMQAFILPFTIQKSSNVSMDQAQQIAHNAYEKLKFKFDEENNNLENLENLVIFWMLHLQSPLGTSKIITPQKILSIKQEIYKTILDKVIIPYLSDCFQTIKSITTQEQLDSVDLIDMIFLEASHYRNLIAQLQTDPNADDIGLFTRNSSMRDPVDANPNWIGWKNKIITKIQEALIEPDNTETKQPSAIS